MLNVYAGNPEVVMDLTACLFDLAKRMESKALITVDGMPLEV